MSRAGAHAGRLHPEEQFVFAMVFALMTGFVVVITMSAARSPLNPLLGGSIAAAGSQTVQLGTAGATHQAGSTAASQVTGTGSPRLDAALAATLGTVLRTHPGQLAVGVIDESTGQEALYAGTKPFSSGSIVTADILAALLVRHEHAATPVTSQQSFLANAMMHNGSAPAALSLWRVIGEGNGLSSANRLLSLTQTIPGAGDSWDQTRTTVADQLQLLTDLTASRSPLSAADRHFALRLMALHGAQRPFGVSAAGSGTTVQAGLLPDGQLWVANSIGVVVRDGRVLLVAVMSAGSTSRAGGIALASAAASAAANVVATAGH